MRSSFDRHLVLPRWVLLLGLLVFLAGQTMPLSSSVDTSGPSAGIVRTRSNVEAWERIGSDLSEAVHGRWPGWDEMGRVAWGVGWSALMVVLPFTVGWLARARPMLWTARLYFLLSAGSRLVGLAVPGNPYVKTTIHTGYWMLTAVPCVYLLGLLLIPRPPTTLIR